MSCICIEPFTDRYRSISPICRLTVCSNKNKSIVQHLILLRSQWRIQEGASGGPAEVCFFGLSLRLRLR